MLASSWPGADSDDAGRSAAPNGRAAAGSDPASAPASDTGVAPPTPPRTDAAAASTSPHRSASTGPTTPSRTAAPTGTAASARRNAADGSAAWQIRRRIAALPPLPAVGTLLRLINDPEVEFKEIAKTISMDRALTSQLLRIANSAFYGFPQEIRTVQQATVIVGRQAVRNLALSTAMVKVRSHMRTNGPLAAEEFWRHSMAVAYGARMLTDHQHLVAPDEAFVAGLLHDVGKVVFMEYQPETYGELLKRAQDGIEPLHLLERETYGVDHAEVGEALCRHWNFPNIVCDAVAAHHDDAAPHDEVIRQIVDLVQIGDALAKISRIGNGSSPHIPSTWLSGSQTFADRPDLLVQTLSELGEEVAASQQIFFNNATGSHIARRSSGRSYSLHVAVRDPDLNTAVEFACRAQDWVVSPRDATSIDLVVADPSLEASVRSDLCDRGIAVADVAEWHGEQISQAWIDVQDLHTWLAGRLKSAAKAA